MRLLHSKDLTFQEFFDEEVPPYAIASHRWMRNEEVSYEDWIEKRKRGSLGYRKILRLCELARTGEFYNPRFADVVDVLAKTPTEGFEWIWIDTCCIDKRSSAELSEAINSMLNWYGNAKIYLAYLRDVDRQSQRWEAQFIASEWFQRGWTLQELLAPLEVIFLDRNFWRLGTKTGSGPPHANASLTDAISRATGIDSAFLISPGLLSIASVAQWMSGRRNEKPQEWRTPLIVSLVFFE